MNPNAQILHHVILAALTNKDTASDLIAFACAPLLENAFPCLPVDVESPTFFACQALTLQEVENKGLRAALLECYARSLHHFKPEWFEGGDPTKLESFSDEAFGAAQSWIDLTDTRLMSMVVLYRAIGTLAGNSRTINPTLPPVSSFQGMSSAAPDPYFVP
jgi:hypothetical protein